MALKEPFEEWHIRCCYPLCDVKEIHAQLDVTDTQWAELIRRAEQPEDAERKSVWAIIYKDKSAAVVLPYDAVLLPTEAVSLVNAVEKFLGKSIEAALKEAEERYKEEFNKRYSQLKKDRRANKNDVER